MAATTQTHIDTLQAQIEQDGTLTNAQKARCQSALYQIAHIVLGGNSASTSNVLTATGKNNGHSG